MNDTVREQILAIRGTGLTNMLDIYKVQQIAFEKEFYELVNYIADHRREYVQFIFTGKA